MPFPPTRAIPSPCPVPPFSPFLPPFREGVEGGAPLGVRRPPPLRKRTGLAQAETGEGAGGLLRYWSGLPVASSRRGGRLLIKRVVPHAPSAPHLSLSLARRPFPAQGAMQKIGEELGGAHSSFFPSSFFSFCSFCSSFSSLFLYCCLASSFLFSNSLTAPSRSAGMFRMSSKVFGAQSPFSLS